VPNVVEIRDGWKLYIVAGGVMPPATIYRRPDVLTAVPGRFKTSSGSKY
jgi:hypothetical protein